MVLMLWLELAEAVTRREDTVELGDGELMVTVPASAVAVKPASTGSKKHAPRRNRLIKTLRIFWGIANRKLAARPSKLALASECKTEIKDSFIDLQAQSYDVAQMS